MKPEEPDDPGGEGPGEGEGDEGDGNTSSTTGGDHPGLDDNTGVSFGTGTDGYEAPTDNDNSNANGDGGGAKPIMLDLDGDGVELVPLESSTARFDINGDGYREHMAWAAPDDGFLVYDKNADGVIEDKDELSFMSYVEGAQTDLEGLRHFDTDGDGLLDPDDAQWGMFRVWQDLDQDGESDPGELRTLDAARISLVKLTSDGAKRLVAGSTVYGEGEYGGPLGMQAFWDVQLRIGPRVE